MFKTSWKPLDFNPLGFSPRGRWWTGARKSWKTISLTLQGACDHAPRAKAAAWAGLGGRGWNLACWWSVKPDKPNRTRLIYQYNIYIYYTTIYPNFDIWRFNKPKTLVYYWACQVTCLVNARLPIAITARWWVVTRCNPLPDYWRTWRKIPCSFSFLSGWQMGVSEMGYMVIPQDMPFYNKKMITNLGILGYRDPQKHRIVF